MVRRFGNVAAVTIAALGLVGCTAMVGVGVTVGVIGVAALTLGCYDRLHVTVRDGGTGREICDASVHAVTPDDDRESVFPCYAATLGEGKWTVTAQKPGFAPQQSLVIVDRDSRGCEPAFHTVELTLNPLSPAIGPLAPLPALAPPPLQAPPTAPAPAAQPAAPPAAPPPEPPTPAPAAAPTNSDPPPSTTPPTGSFPPVSAPTETTETPSSPHQTPPQ